MGASPSKLVMGMPLYGQSFSLADTSNKGLNAKTYGPGEAGDFTRAGGFFAFYEVSLGFNLLSFSSPLKNIWLSVFVDVSQT